MNRRFTSSELLLRSQLWLAAFCWALGSYPLAALAAVQGSPESQTLEISRSLRPISDATWQTIAGTHSSEKYRIEPGDTLFGISKRLFGDASYWPKIWSMNNDTILNPHLILPGHEINFMPGTGVSLPKVSVGDVAPDSSVLTLRDLMRIRKPAHAQEWKNFPEQSWEYASRLRGRENSDSISVSQALTKNFSAETSSQRPYEIYSEPMVPVGEVSQSPGDNVYLSTGDQVFLHPSADFEDGKTYSLSNGPGPVKFIDPAFDETQPDEHRTVMIYPIIGEIVAHHINGVWMGTITNARTFVNRGDLLIPQMDRLNPTTPVPANSAVEGRYYVDPGSVYLAAEGHYGFVDIGSKDGAGEGMLLQSYQSRDPVLKKKLTKQDFFDRTTMQIIQTSDYFSFVKVIAGKAELADGDLVKLLLDVTAFGGPASTVTPIPIPSDEPLPSPTDAAPQPMPSSSPEPIAVPTDIPLPPAEAPPPAETLPSPSENLDHMGDEQEKLSPDEERELKQLEKYKPNESELGAPTSPNPTPNMGDIPPPPPETAPGIEPMPAPDAIPLPAPDATPLPAPDATPLPAPDSTPAINPDESLPSSSAAPPVTAPEPITGDLPPPPPQ